MTAYEFSTHVTQNGALLIPKDYLEFIPVDGSVRVILLVDTNGNGVQPQSNTTLPDQTKPLESMSLEEFVVYLQNRPIDPSSIIPESGLLVEHLANPVSDPDPNFDPAMWNREWARIEEEMDEIERSNQVRVLKQMAKQLA